MCVLNEVVCIAKKKGFDYVGLDLMQQKKNIKGEGGGGGPHCYGYLAEVVNDGVPYQLHSPLPSPCVSRGKGEERGREGRGRGGGRGRGKGRRRGEGEGRGGGGERGRVYLGILISKYSLQSLYRLV